MVIDKHSCKLLLIWALCSLLCISSAFARDGQAATIRESLIEQAQESDQKNIESELECFELRVSAAKQTELLDCYQVLFEALRSFSLNKDSQGLLLCQHLILELAHPNLINQGNHNSCGLAALEVLLATKHPLLLCKIVLQAYSGRVELNDGSAVQIPETNLHPDREAKLYRPGTVYRSFSSQLFQIAAANAFWQSQVREPRGYEVPKGSIKYVQDYQIKPQFPGDTCERLVIDWNPTVKEIVCKDSGIPESSPCFSLKSLAQSYCILTGEERVPAVLVHKGHVDKSGCISFSKSKMLAAELSKLKASSSLPAIICLRTSGRMLDQGPRLIAQSNFSNTETGLVSLSSKSSWHVVCITDYSPIDQKVSVDNFWGDRNDLIGANAIEVQELYSASCPSKSQGSAQITNTLPALIF